MYCIFRKVYFLLAFSLFFSVVNGQTIDGPANLRVKPNGSILFKLNNDVKVHVLDSNSGWYHCNWEGWVKIPVNLALIKQVPVKTELYNVQNKKVGEVLSPMNYIFKGRIRDGFANISLSGYTFRNNIRNVNLPDNAKLYWQNNDISDFKVYRDDGGAYYISTETRIVERFVSLVPESYRTIIKEQRKLRRYFNSEGNEESIFTLEMFPVNDNEKILSSQKLAIEADEVIYDDNVIIGKIKGCCADPNTYRIYNPAKKTLLMQCESVIFKIWDYGKCYYLGFKTDSAMNYPYLGKWIIADEHKVLTEMKVFMKDSSLYESYLPLITYLPNKIEFNNRYYYADQDINIVVFDFNHEQNNELVFHFNCINENGDVRKTESFFIRNLKFFGKDNPEPFEMCN
jgi:hypothetical protein